AARDTFGDLGARQTQTMTVVTHAPFGRELLFARLRQTFGCAKTREGVPRRQELLHVFGVNRAAFALPVGAKRPSDVGPLVPVQTQPAQRRKDRLLARTRAAHLVGVFDAQDELAAMLTRKTQVKEGDVRGPDVGITRRGRRNSSSNGGH